MAFRLDIDEDDAAVRLLVTTVKQQIVKTRPFIFGLIRQDESLINICFISWHHQLFQTVFQLC